MERRREELAVSRHASLLQTSDGYAVQRRSRATIETYPSTDEGFDAAWGRYEELTRAGRSGRALSALIVVAVVAAVLWFGTTLFSGVVYVAAFNSRSDDPLNKLVSWVSSFSTALYALFVGAAGLYGVLWLHRSGFPPATRRR